MPELPEVETVCRTLRAVVPGHRVVGVEVLERRLRMPVGRSFKALLFGRKIVDVERRGKYILLILEGEVVWVSHLGMSGKLIYVAAQRPRERHDHIIVALDRGFELRYHDPRRFGLALALSRRELETWPQFRALGPDPLAGDVASGLYESARGSRRKIRDLLLDQRVLSGLGNIYANEILFYAGIRPTARAFTLTRARAGRIAAAAARLLSEAIQWGGTSFSDYRDGQDRRGEFQQHLRVYGREGESCTRCGRTIKRVSLGNRSAFYCPGCQK
ncbi:MAG TPA: bifunctional DNA-formamidopyrimidine glycosylase/DNA-(apurinic or apyrimidinic site) lyase [Candidatus Acidoferrales bacterium]|nr:bifunctional DNA-formamidopyrimidine glycosylase/DNA-(apurinic or apyrimidinic site) lyase [Candidatus Acidoferrales bacterium]